MRRLLAGEPALVGTLVSAVVGLGIALGVDPTLGAAVGTLLTVVAGLWIRSRVFVPSTVADVATNAAVQAVQAASSAAAGKVGELTDLGVAVATEAARGVLADVGVVPEAA